MTSPLIPIGFRNKPPLEEQTPENLERLIEYNLHLLSMTPDQYEEVLYRNRIIDYANKYHQKTGKWYRREI